MNHHSFRVTRADVRVRVVHLQLSLRVQKRVHAVSERRRSGGRRTFISRIGLHDRHLITPSPNTPGYPLFTPFLRRLSSSTLYVLALFLYWV